MMKNSQSWKLRALTLALLAGCLGTATINASAADKAGASRRGAGFGFLATIDRSVGLSPEQRDTIKGLMAQQREEMRKIRETTDVKIRAVLTGEQQKKFDAFLAEQKAKRSTRGA